MYSFAKVVVGAIYRVLFRLRVEGKENVPTDGGVILCANHRSYHDVVVLGVASPRNLHFLAKYELWSHWFFAKLFTALGGIPVNREKPSMETLKRTVSTLKDGRAIAIFMQGGRRTDINSDDVKSGVALFAVKGKVPVVPVNITSKFKLFSRVDVNIGAPISFEEFWDTKVRTEQLNTIAQRIVDAIARLGEKSIN